ncbi:MAG: hypothetical protein QOG84_2300 [Sphingomonadales bacterium]|jgi:hypothetical protein|nr:hypothetical protein [Sphingomonadales bacterium]
MSRTRKATFAALDAGLALFAGGSAAFALFAMPQALFEALVARSGLQRVLAAAQPPLGADARWAVVAAAGIVTAALAWTILKALDRRPSAPRPAHLEAEDEPPAPAIRLRKADSHPDAPLPLPLRAGRDLGEPLDLEPFQTGETAEEPEEAEAARVEPEPEPEAAPEPEPEAIPPFLVAQEPEPDTAIVREEPPLEPEPEGADSITSLMHRFETGLSRKQQAIRREEPASQAAPAAPVARAEVEGEPAPQPDEPERSVGHRLRSAIAGLQKVSAAGG